MSYKTLKISSLGLLDINLALTLKQSEAESFNLNLDDYTQSEDLRSILSDETESNIINMITLSSNNFLFNSLLFINRSFKQKTHIDYITMNAVDFSGEKQFLKRLLKIVTEKNNISLIENSIIDIPSNILLTIKIIDDKDNHVISQKSFNLFEKNQPLIENKNNEYYLSLLKYNFNCDFLYLDYDDISKFIYKDNKEITAFIDNTVKKYPQIKLISNINVENSAEYIERIDIIICDSKEIYEQMSTYENKKRKNIQRITVFIDNLKEINIMNQKGEKMNVIYQNKYKIFFNDKDNESAINEENYMNLKSVFVGGFLSRIIYNKTFLTCFTAGRLIIEKVLNLIRLGMDDVIRANTFYNVIVPMRKNKKRSYNSTNSNFNKFLVSQSKQNKDENEKRNEIQIYSKPYEPVHKKNPKLQLICRNFLQMRNKMIKNPVNNSNYYCLTTETYYCDKDSFASKSKRFSKQSTYNPNNKTVMNSTATSFKYNKKNTLVLPKMYRTQPGFFHKNNPSTSRQYNQTLSNFRINKCNYMKTINSYNEKANRVIHSNE